MSLGNKRRTVRPQTVLQFVLLIALAAMGYSYYLQSKKLAELSANVQSPTVSEPVEPPPEPEVQQHQVGFDGNDELNKLTCNDGLYADLLTRYGMFEYDKFKAKREYCTVNSPFPVTAGMCLSE